MLRVQRGLSLPVHFACSHRQSTFIMKILAHLIFQFWSNLRKLLKTIEIQFLKCFSIFKNILPPAVSLDFNLVIGCVISGVVRRAHHDPFLPIAARVSNSLVESSTSVCFHVKGQLVLVTVPDNFEPAFFLRQLYNRLLNVDMLAVIIPTSTT